MIKLAFTNEKNGLPNDGSKSLYSMLKISSSLPAAENTRRPLNIAIALDRSGSMAGIPLREAKSCIEMMIDRLSSEDHLSLVTYDDTVDVVFAPQRVTDKEALKYSVRSIRSGGLTALYDGWSSAAELAAQNLNKKSITRVLLLSDGQANQGLTDHDQISDHCAELAKLGVHTTTYGLGEGFNEELMASMAKAGKGMAHYGQTAEDLSDPFNSEFDLLSALIAKDLKLHLTPEPGVRFEVLNQYRRNDDGSFILSDLAQGGELWALLKIDVPNEVIAKAKNGTLKVISSFLDYETMDGEKRRSESASLTIEVVSPLVYAELAIDDLVKRRKVELDAANLQDAARIAARRRDWRQVDEIIDELENLGAENEWVAEGVQKLKSYAKQRETEKFSKEAYYKADNMRMRMGIANESAFYSLSEESVLPSFLRRKSEQGKNQTPKRR